MNLSEATTHLIEMQSKKPEEIWLIRNKGFYLMLVQEHYLGYWPQAISTRDQVAVLKIHDLTSNDWEVVSVEEAVAMRGGR